MTDERFRELEIKYGYEAAKNLKDVSEEVRTKDGKSVADMMKITRPPKIATRSLT